MLWGPILTPQPAKSRKRRRAPRYSLRATARAIPCDEKTLRDAIRKRRVDEGFTVGRRGKVTIEDPEAVKRSFLANRNDAQDRRPGPKPDSVTLAEIRLKEARTRRVEQETAARSGSMVPLARMVRANYERTKTVRENMENIPDRVLPQLAALAPGMDVLRARAILAHEIRRALETTVEALLAAAELPKCEACGATSS